MTFKCTVLACFIYVLYSVSAVVWHQLWEVAQNEPFLLATYRFKRVSASCDV